MHTCKTGLNKGYKMQSICISNCSYLNFKILIILTLHDVAKICVSHMLLMWYRRRGKDDRVTACASCPDMNISVGYLILLVVMKGNVDGRGFE